MFFVFAGTLFEPYFCLGDAILLFELSLARFKRVVVMICLMCGVPAPA